MNVDGISTTYTLPMKQTAEENVLKLALRSKEFFHLRIEIVAVLGIQKNFSKLLKKLSMGKL